MGTSESRKSYLRWTGIVSSGNRNFSVSINANVTGYSQPDGSLARGRLYFTYNYNNYDNNISTALNTGASKLINLKLQRDESLIEI